MLFRQFICAVIKKYCPHVAPLTKQILKMYHIYHSNRSDNKLDLLLRKEGGQTHTEIGICLCFYVKFLNNPLTPTLDNSS